MSVLMASLSGEWATVRLHVSFIARVFAVTSMRLIRISMTMFLKKWLKAMLGCSLSHLSFLR